MADSKVARRYAGALFVTAQKHDVIKSVEDDLIAIASLLESDQKFRDFMLSPRVGRDEKIRIAEKLFSDRITALTMQALRLMLTKRRQAEIMSVRDEFISLRREHGSVSYVQVSSAEALEPDQKNAIVSKLEQKTSKTVEADFRIDPRLIGGVKVQIGDYVLDGTVSGSLRRLEEKLRRDVLKQN